MDLHHSQDWWTSLLLFQLLIRRCCFHHFSMLFMIFYGNAKHFFEWSYTGWILNSAPLWFRLDTFAIFAEISGAILPSDTMVTWNRQCKHPEIELQFQCKCDFTVFGNRLNLSRMSGYRLPDCYNNYKLYLANQKMCYRVQCIIFV